MVWLIVKLMTRTEITPLFMAQIPAGSLCLLRRTLAIRALCTFI